MVHRTPEYTNGPAKRGIVVKGLPKGTGVFLIDTVPAKVARFIHRTGKLITYPLKSLINKVHPYPNDTQPT